MAYRLRAGDTGPVQQSPVTCGSACLTVARMLVDPLFASWVRTGEPNPPGAPSGATEAERFAAYERVVMRRTNSLFAGGHRPNLPWPRRLGTPPWGARRELEYGAARIGTLYTLDVLRGGGETDLVASFDTLVDVVAEGEPALLYVGNALSPAARGARAAGRRRPDARRLRPGDRPRRPPAPRHRRRAPARPQRLGRAVGRRPAHRAPHGALATYAADLGAAPA